MLQGLGVYSRVVESLSKLTESKEKAMGPGVWSVVEHSQGPCWITLMACTDLGFHPQHKVIEMGHLDLKTVVICVLVVFTIMQLNSETG